MILSGQIPGKQDTGELKHLRKVCFQTSYYVDTQAGSLGTSRPGCYHMEKTPIPGQTPTAGNQASITLAMAGPETFGDISCAPAPAGPGDEWILSKACGGSQRLSLPWPQSRAPVCSQTTSKYCRQWPRYSRIKPRRPAPLWDSQRDAPGTLALWVCGSPQARRIEVSRGGLCGFTTLPNM